MTSSVKPYRTIYNMDSSGILLDSTDTDDYLRGIVGFLEHSHVDALFWMDGAGGNTANYDSAVLELTGHSTGAVHPLLMKMIEEGNDPPTIVVREAKRYGVDVFFSMRLNDCHDSLGHDHLVATFKQRHPEWTIGRGHIYGGHQNLNFAIPEVRELKLAAVKEICRKYDFDGLEIDFMRSPPYFMPGEEMANAHILTEFLRCVRRHVDQRARDRGRPMWLAARVDESLEGCAQDGFQVNTWVDERLIDILTMGSGTIDVQVEAFKALTEGTGIQIYPCLYGWPSKYMPLASEMARALAVNYWYQGADGLYTFNWNAHSHAHRPRKNAKWAYQHALLREIGDPETLRGKNKRFAADRGRPTRVYPHNWVDCVLPVSLEAGVGGGAWVDIPIMVGEEFTRASEPKAIELHIDCEELTEDDHLAIKLNWQDVGAPQRSGGRISVTVNSRELKRGRNQVQVSVDTGTATIIAVEMDVTY